MTFTPDSPVPTRTLDEVIADYRKITERVDRLEIRCNKLKAAAIKTEQERTEILADFARVSLDLMRLDR